MESEPRRSHSWLPSALVAAIILVPGGLFSFSALTAPGHDALDAIGVFVGIAAAGATVCGSAAGAFFARLPASPYVGVFIGLIAGVIVGALGGFMAVSMAMAAV